MKLLYVITAYPPSIGGAQLHAHLLAQQLASRHAVSVISQWDTNRTDWLLGTTLRAPGEDRDYEIDGIAVHRIGLSTAEKLRIAPIVPLYYPCMPLALPAIARQLEPHIERAACAPDIIHNVRIGREGLSYATRSVARGWGIPFVFTPLHHPRWVGRRYAAYLKLYRSADAVIALTRAEKDILTGIGVAEERIFVTGMGPVLAPVAAPGRFLEQYGIDGPLVLFIGQHYPYKGYRQLLAAAPLVWQRFRDAHFAFIGPPVGASEKDYAAVRDRRIHRLGQVSLQVKTDALAACFLLCLPSTQESFGGVYTEAWSFGRPVIGCRIPAVQEVIADGIDGCLVDQTPGEIADRIVHLLGNTGRADQMGLNGKRKLEAHYTWERIAARTEDAYRTVMK